MEFVAKFPDLCILPVLIKGVYSDEAIAHFQGDIQRFHDTRGVCAGHAEAVLHHAQGS